MLVLDENCLTYTGRLSLVACFSEVETSQLTAIFGLAIQSDVEVDQPLLHKL